MPAASPKLSILARDQGVLVIWETVPARLAHRRAEHLGLTRPELEDVMVTTPADAAQRVVRDRQERMAS